MSNISIIKTLKARVLEIKWDALLIEDNALSLGRVMGWVVFSSILYLWLKGQEPPVSMVETFWALLVYNANKKVIGPLTSYLSTRSLSKGSSSTQEIEPYERSEQQTPPLPLPRVTNVPTGKPLKGVFSTPDRKSTVTFIDEDPFKK